MGIDGTEIRNRERSDKIKQEDDRRQLVSCRVCQGSVSDNADCCPHCGEPMRAGAFGRSGLHSKAAGLAGSALVALGAFCPVLSASFFGDFNLFHNGKGDGVGLLLLVGLSVLFILFDKMRFLYYSAAGCLALIAYDFYELRGRIAEMIGSADADLAGNPMRGIADAALQSVQMQWGWVVLLVGCGLLFAGAYYRRVEA